jgi:hypothetical protein
MSYLDQLRRQSPKPLTGSPPPSPTNYLALLQRPAPRSPRPSRTLFARAYASLLPQRHLFAALGPTTGKSRRLFYDGRDINASVLVELCELCAHDGVPVGIDIVRRVAEALACPAVDPYEERLRAWLDDAIAATLPLAHDDGCLARINLNTMPHWFVSMRDLKAELDAYGAANVRRLRSAMKALGWRERRAIAWGRRTAGFVRPVQTANNQ